MRILCLYNNNCALKLFEWLELQGHTCIYWSDKIELDWLKKQECELAVSYTYSRLIQSEIIKFFKGNIVNLHTSYLPFNRGVDPNIWSIIDNTPRGVTLHFIDEKLDQGFIISQVLLGEVDGGQATLKSTYDELDIAAFELFKNSFKNYSHWHEMKKKVYGVGTYHTDKQGIVLRNHITSFDMKICDFLETFGK